MNAVQTSTPTLTVLRTRFGAVGYLQARQIAKDNNMRLATNAEFGTRLLSGGQNGTDYRTVISALCGWTNTNVAHPEPNGCLLKGESIVDTHEPGLQLVLPAEYVKKASEKGDPHAKNMAIVYNVEDVEADNGRIVFHPSEIFVQPYLSKTGVGKLNLETHVAEPVSEKKFDKLEWTLQSHLWRINGAANRPLARGGYFDDIDDGRRDVYGNLGLDDGLGVVGSPIGPQAQIVEAPKNGGILISGLSLEVLKQLKSGATAEVKQLLQFVKDGSLDSVQALLQALQIKE